MGKILLGKGATDDERKQFNELIKNLKKKAEKHISENTEKEVRDLLLGKEYTEKDEH